ncbi:M16 family metallopeptidase [Olivibacter sitiensis]|uniref:M16 family metallopeptidase n=1 Tax=Olivibacter sitiensis TaxID=376470 RepID=UPI000427DFEB|nr:pitrilysin family protein [Olivibacter sitiensis]
MEYQQFTLKNGIRVMFLPANSPIAHACVVVNAGSRDETPSQYGLAHFIEHLLFKKTEKRSTNQILNRLELVGADLNAYTTKEYTCIHASFLKEHLPRTLDLFEDILFHSVFPDQEIEKERGVILDEIASYIDSPEEAIADDFEDIIFAEHPLGHNILGNEESLGRMRRPDVLHFMHQHYVPEEIVVAITGNYDPKKIHHWAQKYFGLLPEKPAQKKKQLLFTHEPKRQEQAKPISQFHSVLGSIAYDLHHPDKYALMLLNNYLGGMGMSSKLNLQIREKYGIAYTIESSYVPFSDTGLFTIYYGTDMEKAKKCEKLIQKELQLLCQQKLGKIQLHQAKRKFMGQIALGEENRIGVLIAIAKNILDYGRVNSLEEVLENIEAVSAEQVLRVANEVLHPERLTTLSFVPQA